MPSERFEGAITTAPAPPLDPIPPPSAARPVLVELAAAILIVGGTVGLATGLSPFQPGVFPWAWLFLILNLATIVVGVLVRAGRAWAVALNVTAIALFLELTALPSPLAVLFVALDTVVLFALIRHRPWFDASTTARGILPTPSDPAPDRDDG